MKKILVLSVGVGGVYFLIALAICLITHTKNALLIAGITGGVSFLAIIVTLSLFVGSEDTATK